MTESTTTLPDGTTRLAPCTGTSFTLSAGQHLTIIDPNGSQVSDLLAFNAHDTAETMSNGRTFDYNRKIYLTKDDTVYSNRSNAMLRIVEDTVGRHDFLVTPCSAATFKRLFPEQEPKPGCFGNFAYVLERFGIGKDAIPVPFNCFMNVTFDGGTGELRIMDPVSKAGNRVVFVAETDLIVALTACSAPRSNAGVCKEIAYRID